MADKGTPVHSVLVRDKIYINGAWVPSTGKGALEVIDSATEEVFATIPEGTAEDVDKAVEAAAAAFPGWAATSREERAKLLVRIGEALGARTDELAEVISHEVGMPMTLSGAIQVGLPAGDQFPTRPRSRTGSRWRLSR